MKSLIAIAAKADIALSNSQKKLLFGLYVYQFIVLVLLLPMQNSKLTLHSRCDVSSSPLSPASC